MIKSIYLELHRIMVVLCTILGRWCVSKFWLRDNTKTIVSLRSERDGVECTGSGQLAGYSRARRVQGRLHQPRHTRSWTPAFRTTGSEGEYTFALPLISFICWFLWQFIVSYILVYCTYCDLCWWLVVTFLLQGSRANTTNSSCIH